MISDQRKAIILEKLAQLSPQDAAFERRAMRRARPLGGVTLTKKENLPLLRLTKKTVRKEFKGLKPINSEQQAMLDRVKSKKFRQTLATGLGSEYRRRAAERKGIGAYHDVQAGMTRPVQMSRTAKVQNDALPKRSKPAKDYAEGTKKSK